MEVGYATGLALYPTASELSEMEMSCNIELEPVECYHTSDVSEAAKKK